MKNKFTGQAITDGLRAFNSWRDDFLIELSTLFLMAGFVAGTVDVLTSNGLSQIPWFSVAWAIVQAIAIDGLFFAVWGKIRRATWSRATWFRSLVLVLVGLLLAVAASLVNGLLSYQELNRVADISTAMANLGIDQATFAYARAILVVLVSILVALFCREAGATEQEDVAPIVQAIAPAVRVTPVVAPVAIQTPQATAIPEQASSVAHSSNEDDSPIAGSPDNVAQQASPKERTTKERAIEVDHIVAIGSEVRDRIKEAMVVLPEANYQAIADKAGCGYSTVKKYAKAIREELAS